jgi:LPS O-antigen subunit length determinant protein (WzzB/FepE family)
MQSERDTIVALSKVIAEQAMRIETMTEVQRGTEQQLKQLKADRDQLFNTVNTALKLADKAVAEERLTDARNHITSASARLAHL